MGRWMESHFHVWIDNNGIAFSMHFLNGVAHLRLANVPECLYCQRVLSILYLRNVTDEDEFFKLLFRRNKLVLIVT